MKNFYLNYTITVSGGGEGGSGDEGGILNWIKDFLDHLCLKSTTIFPRVYILLPRVTQVTRVTA